jgi:hypothetical protein
MNLRITFSESDFDAEVLRRLKSEAIKRGISLQNLLVEIAVEKAQQINSSTPQQATSPMS